MLLPVQVKNPSTDLPIGIVGSLVVCGFLYALMCVVICLMVPYSQIDVNAPFSEAFQHILTTTNDPSLAKTVFLNVVSRIVSLGALTGDRPLPCSCRPQRQRLASRLMFMLSSGCTLQPCCKGF